MRTVGPASLSFVERRLSTLIKDSEMLLTLCSPRILLTNLKESERCCGTTGLRQSACTPKPLVVVVAKANWAFDKGTEVVTVALSEMQLTPTGSPKVTNPFQYLQLTKDTFDRAGSTVFRSGHRRRPTPFV